MTEPTRLQCPGCQARIRIPAAAIGRTVKCPRCGQPILPAPVVVTPPPAEPSDPFAALAETFAATAVRPPQARQSGRSWLWLGLALLMATGVGLGAVVGPKLLRPAPPSGPESAPSSGGEPSTVFTQAGKVYPRRMLVVSVTKYLYLNPLAAGNAINPDLVSIAARRLAYQWRVPTTGDRPQLAVVSDVGADPTPGLKSVVRSAVESFAKSSRAQDRELVYFGGHAAMVDGKAYLVPTDGDLEDAATLYPLADFFQAIASSAAQEKQVVFDVARLDESGNRERPGSEPLSQELETALLSPPPGVRVTLSTKAGENAWEFRSPPSSQMPEVGGSLFLSAVTHLAERGKVSPSEEPTPADPLPVSLWLDAIQKRMTAVAEEAGLAPPTLQTRGETGTQAVAVNDAEPLPPPVAVAEVPAGLPVEEVALISKRVSDLPPYRGKPSDDDRVDRLIPYQKNILSDYRPEGPPDEEILAAPEKYPVRVAAIQALELLKREWRSAGSATEGGLRTEIRGATGNALKKEILAEQEVPARLENELDMLLRKIEKAGDRLADEPSKYWQVTYLYAVAQVKARLAFIQEYNRALGLIRTDSIPKVDESKGEAGLALVSSERMLSSREVKELAESAAEDFAKVAEAHPGTPWAVLARRHQLMALGLQWKPSVFGKSVKLD